MTDNDHPNQVPPPFQAVLTQHRSLGPRGFAVLMAALCLINFAVGVAFWWLGAWPILLFCGLDVALIYVAFKSNYRAARAYEVVALSARSLTVTSVDADGGRQVFEFNPYWVRLDLREHHDGRAELELSHHGRRLVFGRCLTDDEKRDFAVALRAELARARTVINF